MSASQRKRNSPAKSVYTTREGTNQEADKTSSTPRRPERLASKQGKGLPKHIPHAARSSERHNAALPVHTDAACAAHLASK